MTRNKLTDLNNHLFEQLERLNDDSLNNEELDKEIRRARAVSDVAKTIIENGRLALNAEELKAEYGGREVRIPLMLEEKNER